MLECFMSGGVKIKTITLRLDDTLHKEFKKYSVEIEKTMQDIIIELLKKELSKVKK